MGKTHKQTLLQEEMQMADEHGKRCEHHWVLGKYRLKPRKYHYSPIRTAGMRGYDGPRG